MFVKTPIEAKQRIQGKEDASIPQLCIPTLNNKGNLKNPGGKKNLAILIPFAYVCADKVLIPSSQSSYACRGQFTTSNKDIVP